jgi:hypothetical protein
MFPFVLDYPQGAIALPHFPLNITRGIRRVNPALEDSLRYPNTGQSPAASSPAPSAPLSISVAFFSNSLSSARYNRRKFRTASTITSIALISLEIPPSSFLLLCESCIALSTAHRDVTTRNDFFILKP